MSDKQDGRAPSGQATQASPEAAGASSPFGEYPSRGELMSLIAAVREKQLSGDEHVACSMEVTRFIAGLPSTSRVFCRGEVRNPDKQKWYPAVLTFNTVSRQTRAWAPSGRKRAMEAHHEAFFWSRISHEGIAREVLCDRDASEAENAKRLSGEAVAARAEGIAR